MNITVVTNLSDDGDGRKMIIVLKKKILNMGDGKMGSQSTYQLLARFSRHPSINFILINLSVLKHNKLHKAFSASNANPSPS